MVMRGVSYPMILHGSVNSEMHPILGWQDMPMPLFFCWLICWHGLLVTMVVVL